jgi:hypothetical protein
LPELADTYSAGNATKGSEEADNLVAGLATHRLRRIKASRSADVVSAFENDQKLEFFHGWRSVV